VLSALVGPPLLDDLRLLVSELVTNAVVHGAPGEAEPIDLEVTTDGPVRVDVVDRGAGFAPGPRRSDPLGGWGLVLVERLADRWGVAEEAGTRVWFEVDVPQARAAR
jgi:anti-sigma regulatory factor (Ser/Thr protein kinase)